LARFLADESCAIPVIRVLRDAGHDITAIAEDSPGITDENVIEIALRDHRILITEDTDFGELVYAHAYASAGVILVRFPVAARSRLAPELLHVIEVLGDRLVGAFVVLQPGRARISRGAGG
jgi:predicted nuclease of predicted toxin-antitoxin system